MGAGAEVDEHPVGREPAQLAEQLDAPEVARLGHPEVALRAGDEAQARNRRVDHEALEVELAPRHVLGEARARGRHAERGVQVRALEVGVDRDHALARARHRGGQVRGQHGLADAALAAAHGEQAGRARAREAGVHALDPSTTRR